MKWEPSDAAAGDIIRIRLGSVYHYGIFVSEDEVVQFGLPPTAENRAAEGEVRVLATDIDTFACGCIVETAQLDRGERKRRVPPAETVSRARARIGEGGYNLLHNNCEHFVNECVFDESRCTQEEEVRRRWLNRPVCDVYLTAVLPGESTEGIFPEKRRAELNAIASPEARSCAVAQWRLLTIAAARSFHLDLPHAGLKRRIGGKWVSDRFYFCFACADGVAAAAVSNAPVSLQMGDRCAENDRAKRIKQPRTAIAAGGTHVAAAKYFWVTDGAAVLMGGSCFE